MNRQQESFALNYITDPKHNATQAAIDAGYSEKTAYSQGQRLLKSVEISNYIDSRINKANDKAVVKLDITVQSVLTGIHNLAMTAENENVRLKAFELEGKYLALFTEKVQNTHTFDFATLSEDERKATLAKAIEVLNKDGK